MNDQVWVLYTNHRCEQRWRLIRPDGVVFFGATAWHPVPQWLLKVFDLEKMQTREYAMTGISEWRPAADAYGNPLPKPY